MFFEGARQKKNTADFMTAQQFEEEQAQKENWENLSAGDFEADYDSKFKVLDDRKMPKQGFFEK